MSIGYGCQSGPLRPDYGDNWAEVECNLCGAGWVGIIEEDCAYCELREERTLVDQKRLLLWPNLPDIDDSARPNAIGAWAERLALGVTAEIITRQEARHAFDRENGRGHVAAA
jgi:hypothetical protein